MNKQWIEFEFTGDNTYGGVDASEINSVWVTKVEFYGQKEEPYWIVQFSVKVDQYIDNDGIYTYPSKHKTKEEAWDALQDLLTILDN